ncbi:MAG: hypothetical protein PHR35_14995 [Kiritimatiellae bacterium]|nr:hypothetical protein [Kiritimatiellia bacterium]
MSQKYCDKHGHPMTRDEVYNLPVAELEARSGIPLRILPDRPSLYDAVADVMIGVLGERRGRKTTMILPVGPIGQYPAFAEKVRDRRIDCRQLWTINMDEFVDRNGRTIPESHPLSFKAIMGEHFFSRIPEDLRMPAEQMFFPRLDSMDAIDRAFDQHAPDGVDLCLAGVGPEGHFAFNENPNFGHVVVSDEEFLRDRTRLVPVNASTVDMDALVASCGDRSAVPPFAVTIGPRDVLRSKRLEAVFFAGKFQRVALRETLFRVPTALFPGSLLKRRMDADGRLTAQRLTVWATPDEAGPVTVHTI